MRVLGRKLGIVLVVALALVPTAAILPAGAATAPAAPAKPTASPGNASARVTWVAPANGGSAITHYIVTPFIGTTAQMERTFPAPAVTQVITGLANGTTYTFKVKARNAIGTGLNSVASAPVKVGTPVAPAKPGVAPGNASARVHWVAPAANGSAITGYNVLPFIGTAAQPPARPFGSGVRAGLITGLTNGTTYTFKVAATNGVGQGPFSVASAAVKPTALATLRLVNNATIGQPILVNSYGMTVYMYVPDADATPTVSNVNGGLRVAWPYVTWAGTLTVGAGLTLASATAHIQPDNSRLIGYNGHLLYTFVNDHAPGDVTGQGVNQFFVLDANGNKIP
jgi:predicted lipoprotein with Yx(FWY)xxD motif